MLTNKMVSKAINFICESLGSKLSTTNRVFAVFHAAFVVNTGLEEATNKWRGNTTNNTQFRNWIWDNLLLWTLGPRYCIHPPKIDLVFKTRFKSKCCFWVFSNRHKLVEALPTAANILGIGFWTRGPSSMNSRPKRLYSSTKNSSWFQN
jgi:hypothetical protein